jgi:hypothetical protein
MTRTVNKRDVSQESEPSATIGSIALKVVLFITGRRPITSRSGTRLVIAFIYLGVGVAQLDGDIAL